jgi:hypothetical protein
MSEHPERPAEPASRYDDDAAAGLARMAPQVQAALVALGFLTTLATLRTLAPEAVLAALVRLGGFVLAGWMARRLLLAAARLLELLAAGTQALTRLAAISPRQDSSPAAEPTASPAATPVETRNLALAEIRLAIRQGQWSQAESLIQTFAEEYSDDNLVPRLNADLATARQTAIAALRARIEAARTATDSDRIFELRADLAPLLPGDELQALDRDLARWFMHLVQTRLRKGIMTTEIAHLAARIATDFDTTQEGASLRASLPTLRRSVGLCPRCGQPYTGIADACPTCLSGSAPGVFTPSASAATSPRNGSPPQPLDPAPEEETDPERDWTNLDEP